MPGESQPLEVNEVKGTELEVAAETVDQERSFQLMIKLGQAQVSGYIARQCTYAQARLIKQLKEAQVHKHMNLTWEDFCPRELHMNRATADRIIAKLETFGEDYFAVSQHVRIAPSTFAALEVREGKLLIDGQEVRIARENESLIREHVETVRRELSRKEEQLEEKDREAKKLKEERNEQKRAAEAARERLAEMQKAEQALFPNADEHHKRMLLIQTRVDEAVMKLNGLATEQLSPENQARIIGLAEYMWRAFSQVAQMVRDNYGIGDNAPEPFDAEMIEAVTPNARDLAEEYRQWRGKKGAK